MSFDTEQSGSYRITSPERMAEMVQAYGFLPLLRNRIPGFSVQEHTPPEYWFAEDRDGPWEWKGPVIRLAGCAYGKFFGGKTGFITADWYRDFANYRRDGYDFDARYEDGLARHLDKTVYDTLIRYTGPDSPGGETSLFSRSLRKLSCLTAKGDRSRFEAVISRLQMQGYLITADFAQTPDKHGNLSGWGVARYAVPEVFFGDAFTDHVYDRTPAESRLRIEQRLRNLLPQASDKDIAWIVG